jgi:hypothetical protein
MPQITYLWNEKRPLAGNTRKNAGRESGGAHRPALCIWNVSFPTWRVAKHSCCFREYLFHALR